MGGWAVQDDIEPDGPEPSSGAGAKWGSSDGEWPDPDPVVADDDQGTREEVGLGLIEVGEQQGGLALGAAGHLTTEQHHARHRVA